MAPWTLTDRTALVTGASRGIGAATARVFAQAGARVVLVSRDQHALEEVATSIRADGGVADVLAADLTDPEQVAGLVDRIEGGVDVLAAFAGGSTGRPVPIPDLDPSDWAAALDANLTATFATVRAVLPGMVERRSGSIVTMSSSAARGSVPAPAAYAAAKAGISAFTRQLALSVAEHQIRANCLAPSTIHTERLDRVPEERLVALAKQHPLGRLGEPRDVANAALFLSSDASAWITGITLDVAGGLVM